MVQVRFNGQNKFWERLMDRRKNKLEFIIHKSMTSRKIYAVNIRNAKYKKYRGWKLESRDPKNTRLLFYEIYI